MSTLKHREAALRGRIGGFATAATHDTKQITAAARATFLARFEREVDPHNTLSAAERQRRAEAAKKLHFARLALKSAQARRRAVAKKGGAMR